MEKGRRTKEEEELLHYNSSKQFIYKKGSFKVFKIKGKAGGCLLYTFPPSSISH
jgi:hypothetical protein